LQNTNELPANSAYFYWMKKFPFILIVLLNCCSAFAQNLFKTMMFDGESRSYRIYIPSIYDSSQPVPLVMALHGLGDNANNFQGVGFNDVADTVNFIAVYPNALPDPLLGGSAWNTGIYPGNNYDDVGFLNALLDTIEAGYSIDTNRIYCTGFSLGGFMTYRMACESGARFAAVASVAGSLPAPSIAACYPEEMSVLHIHGTSDQTIPYNFGNIYVVVTNLGADSTTHYWASHNNCDFPAAHDSLPNLKNDGLTFEKFSYTECGNSSEVILFKANGMTHTWPYSPANDIDATAEIWSFFSRHSKATPATGTIEAEGEYSISAFPNPARDNIWVNSTLPGRIKVMLRDLAGKEVYRSDFSISSFSLLLQDLEEGIYLISLVNQNASATSKLVITR